MRSWRIFLALAACTASCATARVDRAQVDDATYDVLLRSGTIVDGTGLPRYRADVGVRAGRVVAIGDLRAARAVTDLDVTGLFVTPGFINLHSHANAEGLMDAVNMLTQGVTMELLNSDGGGPLDVAQQLLSLQQAGLAVNIGGYAGFNTVWAAVNGQANSRPTAAQLDSMSRLIVANLERGAWGVSAGLDYKPAYYATANEVIQALRAAARWRTNFPNHDRLTPESGYSSRVGIVETMSIADATGMMPVITHMKVAGREHGTAGEILRLMAAADRYTAADAYPYLAGQTALFALIIPGWAQEGGRAAMLQRFADPALRARIAREAEEAMDARFGGAAGVYIPSTRTELTDVMRQHNVSAGEAVIRVLQESNPSAILRFGTEPDLVRILQHPTTSIACDCGASRTAAHPRYFGAYPRVLGRYVRQQRALTWEDAVRKMTALPAATIGLSDRGVLAVGMAADIAVFDTASIIDHATFDQPMLPSVGVRHVLVNGAIAVRDGLPTGARAGQALRRATWMPSRPMDVKATRTVTARGDVTGEDGTAMGTLHVTVSQAADDPRATGTFRFVQARTGATVSASAIGYVQTMAGWSAITGLARVDPGNQTRTFTLYLQNADPFMRNGPSMTLHVDGSPPIRGSIGGGSVLIQSGR